MGMGGWLNFSSDHVEPIKADHGTHPPPPTSSTFFVLSLFPPRVLAFIHPLSAPLPRVTRESVLFLGFILFPLAPVTLARASPFASLSLLPALAPSPPPPVLRALAFVLLLPPLRLSPLASSTHSLSGNSLDFFASRGGVIYLAEVERHPRRWSTKRV